MKQAREVGIKVINKSPIRADVSDDPDAEWVALRPGSDVAFMLGLAHTMVTEGLHAIEFLDRCPSDFLSFRPI